MVASTKMCSIDSPLWDTSIAHGFMVGTNQERLRTSHEVGLVRCGRVLTKERSSMVQGVFTCYTSWDIRSRSWFVLTVVPCSIDVSCRDLSIEHVLVLKSILPPPLRPLTSVPLTPYLTFLWSPTTTTFCRDILGYLTMFPKLVEYESFTLKVSRWELPIGGVYLHRTGHDRLQNTSDLWNLVPKNRHFFETKVIFNNFPETFETSHLAQSTQLKVVPIHCRCLFWNWVTGTPSNLRSTVCTTGFGCKLVW